MIKNGIPYGQPVPPYTATEAEIKALVGAPEGSVAYAADKDILYLFENGIWSPKSTLQKAPHRNLLCNPNFAINQRLSYNVIYDGKSGMWFASDRWRTYRGYGSGNLRFGNLDSAKSPGGRKILIGRTAGDTITYPVCLSSELETAESIPLRGKYLTAAITAFAQPNYSGSAAGFRIIYGTGNDQNIFNGFSSQTELCGKEFVPSTSGYPASPYVLTSPVPLPDNATQVAIQISYNPTGTAGADDGISIGAVQLEVGTEFTGFDFPTAEENLARCQRYFEKTFPLATPPAVNQGNTGFFVQTVFSDTGGYARCHAFFRVRKRTTPAISVYGTGNSTNWDWSRSGGSGSGPVYVDFRSESGWSGYIGTGIATAAGMIFGHWTADADF